MDKLQSTGFRPVELPSITGYREKDENRITEERQDPADGVVKGELDATGLIDPGKAREDVKTDFSSAWRTAMAEVKEEEALKRKEQVETETRQEPVPVSRPARKKTLKVAVFKTNNLKADSADSTTPNPGVIFLTHEQSISVGKDEPVVTTGQKTLQDYVREAVEDFSRYEVPATTGKKEQTASEEAEETPSSPAQPADEDDMAWLLDAFNDISQHEAHERFQQQNEDRETIKDNLSRMK